MNRKINFDLSRNPVSMDFAIIVKDLERIANDSGIPTSRVILDFISDLQNYNKEDYDKRVQGIELEGLTPDIFKSLGKHLNIAFRQYKPKDDRTRRKVLKEQMQGKWKQFEKSIDGNIMDSEVMQKIMDDIENSDLSRNEKNFMKVQLDEKIKEFNETWEAIEGIVERESAQNSNKTKPEYWQAVRKLIADRDQRLNIKMDEEMQKQMILMIDERISSEKDNLYYEQVKAFTSDFSFLRDDPLIARATIGTRKVKFTDRESYDRYCNLRTLLQEGYRGEYQKIERLLNDGKVDNGDIRILEQRLKVMEKEASKMPDAR